MKKNWFLRIGLIALVLTVATTCLVGGTFAKYTTTVSGADTIEVARFHFTANDAIDGLTPYDSVAAIDLFDDADTSATNTVVAGNIAPGVGGTFMIVLDATTTDVDLVFTDSDFVAIVNDGGVLTTATEFISYKISWGVDTTVADAADAAVLEAAYYSKAPELETDIRHTLVDLSADLTAKLDSFVVAKGTALVVKVAYEWVNDDAFDAADSAIGAGVLDITTIQGTVSITASQKMTANVGGDYTISGFLADVEIID